MPLLCLGPACYLVTKVMLKAVTIHQAVVTISILLSLGDLTMLLVALGQEIDIKAKLKITESPRIMI